MAEDAPLRAIATQQAPKAWEAYEALDFGAAGAAIQAISGRANQYLEQQAPWTSLKKVTAVQHKQMSNKYSNKYIISK